MTAYITSSHQVAVHDPLQRTLTVHTPQEFTDLFAGSPVDYIVDIVLKALQRPTEHLEI